MRAERKTYRDMTVREEGIGSQAKVDIVHIFLEGSDMFS